MSAVPTTNSRTPLLAAHRSSQQHQSSSSSTTQNPHPDTSRTTSRSTSPHAFASRDRPPNPSTTSFIRRRSRRKSPPVQFIPAVLTLGLLGFVMFLAWDVSSYGNCYFRGLCDLMGEGERMDMVWWENSGAYAPWKSLGPGGGKRGLPRGCEINQVTVLHRHAARYPTSAAAEGIKGALDKIANRRVAMPRRHGELTFLAKADLQMTGWKFDQLLNQGRRAAWRSGKELEALYHSFVRSSEGLFSRSSGGDRVVESAGYWLEGFHDQPFKLKPVEALPHVNLTIPEGETVNNTLSVHNCPAYFNQSDKDLSGILDMLKPARDRLNRVLAPRPLLELDDLICLADMCPYDSQVEGDEWQAWSRWCGIFDRDEWAVIGHYKDTKRYYEVGEGSPYGATMGAGWVNELVARLTDSAPIDSANINRTLDFNEKTFPQGGRRFFVDYSHDQEMIQVITAMGLLKQQRPLSTDSLPEKRTYVTAEIIPFGSRMIFERIGCDLGEWEPDPENPEGGGDGRKNYLRIFVNDVLQPIEHISCQQSGFVEHKMCEVELFLESQTWAQEEVDWDICYAKQS